MIGKKKRKIGIYNRIGTVLLTVAKYLKNSKGHNMRPAIEIICNFLWIVNLWKGNRPNLRDMIEIISICL